MHFSDLLHIDRHLPMYIQQYGIWFYGIMFLILFAETGFVVTPVLPGDTLLFAAGIFAGSQSLSLPVLLVLLTLAPIAGDTLNYHIGKFFGPKIFSSGTSKIFNRKHLAETHDFFEKYGPQAVMIARWVPIVRTYVPFVGGLSGMPFRIFIRWSALGAFTWVWVCTLAGYFFGRIHWVRQNFEVAMLAMALVTCLPVVVKVYSSQRARRIRLSAVAVAVED